MQPISYADFLASRRVMTQAEYHQRYGLELDAFLYRNTLVLVYCEGLYIEWDPDKAYDNFFLVLERSEFAASLLDPLQQRLFAFYCTEFNPTGV